MVDKARGKVGTIKNKTQADNSHTSAKVVIRRHVLDALTPERAVVFDAFAGSGQMWQAVWRHATDYVGCDERLFDDERRCFVADNRRVLRCIDLAPFTCFDLDAYGGPWEQALIIAARRPRLESGDRIGFVFTDGSWAGFRTGHITAALRRASGVLQVRDLGRTLSQSSTAAKKATVETRIRRFDEMLTRAIHHVAQQMNGRIVRQWRATALGGPLSGSYMRYIGIVIDGV